MVNPSYRTISPLKCVSWCGWYQEMFIFYFKLKCLLPTLTSLSQSSSCWKKKCLLHIFWRCPSPSIFFFVVVFLQKDKLIVTFPSVKYSTAGISFPFIIRPWVMQWWIQHLHVGWRGACSFLRGAILQAEAYFYGNECTCWKTKGSHSRM